MVSHLFRVARALFSASLLLLVCLLLAVSCSGDAETTAQEVEVAALPTSTPLPTPAPPEAQPTSTPIPTVAPAAPTALPTTVPPEAPAAAPASAPAESSDTTESSDSASTDAAQSDAQGSGETQPAARAPAGDSGRCLLGDIELPVPAGWSQSGCQSFAAVADFATAGDCPCQYPIDAVRSQEETWEAATARIQNSASYAISGSSDRTVGGKPARVYETEVVNDQGQRFTQTVAVVDLTDEVLYIAATQNATTQPADHTWDETRAAFFGILDGTVIDGVRTVTDVPAEPTPEPAAAAEPAQEGVDTTTTDAATTDATTDSATDPEPTPTVAASDPAATDSGCPALPPGATGDPSIIDLNADGRNEVILPNALTGDGMKFELFSHNGDCAWASKLQLIDRQGVEPKLSFVCRPNPDSGWFLVEQTRDDNPNGGERVKDQLYLFDGASVIEDVNFVYQIDDPTVVWGPTFRFAPLQDGDRELCR